MAGCADAADVSPGSPQPVNHNTQTATPTTAAAADRLSATGRGRWPQRTRVDIAGSALQPFGRRPERSSAHNGQPPDRKELLAHALSSIAAMASTRGLAVIAVDPAHTSRWASKYRWRHTLNCSSGHCCSSHHAAAVVIARRGLGLGARRKACERSIKRCDCPTKPTPSGVGVGGAKTRTAQTAGRGCVSAPLKTRRQPRTQRSATPFGAPLRAPPVPRHR